jgi:hypothetical protein
MKTIVIATQAEFDALPDKFSEYTCIEIRSTTSRIIVSKARENSSVVAWENSSVVAWGNSSVVARENSSVEARENSSVVAWENSSVVAWGNSSVEARENSSVVARENSSVVAWGNSSVVAWENSSVEARENSSVVARENSSVVAWGNSSVVARENSSVVAWENSSVEAWGNSSVEAWGNSSVVARENSSVVAWENSSVVAWENSSVEAWGNSSVEAWENVGVHVQSPSATILLFTFSVAWALCKTKLIKKESKTAQIIEPIAKEGTEGWLDSQGIKTEDTVILFKRVSIDFKTQEGTPNETSWTPGTKGTHQNWNPMNSECGEGKFHACSRTYFCDEFRNNKDDKYVALLIKKEDLYSWPNPTYPHKIAFKSYEVLYECDRKGNKK